MLQIRDTVSQDDIMPGGIGMAIPTSESLSYSVVTRYDFCGNVDDHRLDMNSKRPHTLGSGIVVTFCHVVVARWRAGLALFTWFFSTILSFQTFAFHVSAVARSFFVRPVPCRVRGEDDLGDLCVKKENGEVCADLV